MRLRKGWLTEYVDAEPGSIHMCEKPGELGELTGTVRLLTCGLRIPDHSNRSPADLALQQHDFNNLAISFA